MRKKLYCYLTVITFLLISIPLQAITTSNNSTSLSDAIQLLEGFRKEINNIRHVSSQRLGPYTINTQCTWCSERAWWGLGLCTKETTETWNPTIDFSWTRERIIHVINNIDKDASTFHTQFNPTQKWIEGLPIFSENFNKTSDLILAIHRDINNGIGPSDQQQQTVIDALTQLTAALAQSKIDLEQGTSAIADSLQKQTSYKKSIKTAIDGADQSAQDSLNEIQQSSKTHHCQDGLNEKFDTIRSDFSKSLTDISNAYQILEASNIKAEKGIATLLGAIVSSQSDLKSILELLNAAKNDQLGSFIERLHLSAAKKQWEDLVEDSVGSTL